MSSMSAGARSRRRGSRGFSRKPQCMLMQMSAWNPFYPMLRDQRMSALLQLAGLFTVASTSLTSRSIRSAAGISLVNEAAWPQRKNDASATEAAFLIGPLSAYICGKSGSCDLPRSNSSEYRDRIARADRPGICIRYHRIGVLGIRNLLATRGFCCDFFTSQEGSSQLNTGRPKRHSRRDAATIANSTSRNDWQRYGI